MATIRIYLDTRSSGMDAPLKLAVNHNSGTSFIPLNVRVRPDQWERRTQEVVNHPNGRRINLLLSGKRNAAERVILALSDSGEVNSLTATDIRDRIWAELDPGRKSRVTFLSRLERVKGLKERENTRNTYEWTEKKLKDFDPGLKERGFGDITVDYLKDLDLFYSDLSLTSRSILFRCIRSVFNDAIDAKVTTEYPFRSFRIKNPPVKKKALSLDEMRLLSTCKGEYRDMFMLMFYFRGINVGDLLSARKEQIKDGRFEYRRSKVGSLFSIKVEPEAQEIIERHRGENYLLSPLDRYKDYKDYLHHLNAGLKKIGAERGKNNKILTDGYFPGLSTNWARHTWASIGINLDIPKETISRGMGHGYGLSVTDIYIDFDMKKVDEANRKIIDAIGG